MNNGKPYIRGILFFAVSLLLTNANAQESALSRGAIILAEKREPVSFVGENGVALTSSGTVPGTLLPEGTVVQTGKGGSALLLLSNGTIVTVDAETRMKVTSFVQEPFDDKGMSVGDLKEEPSSSSVLVDLDIGSLVVKTKKLNKKSNFEISSAVGTAGIRGTQFGMAFSPKRGMSLDVTESTVSFKPRGGGQERMVPAGRGLTAPPKGPPTQRPVNPVVSAKINTTNNKATQTTEKISLGYVTKAMDKATQENPPKKGEDRRRRNQENDQPREEPSPGGEGEKKPGEGPARKERDSGRDPEGNNRGTEQGGPSREPSNNAGRKPESNRPKAGGDQQGKPLPPVAANLPMKADRPRTNEILENTPDIKQARKTGKVSKATKQLAKLALEDKQTIKFHEFPEQAQNKLIQESPEVMKRMLAMEGFGAQQAEAFLGYSSKTRSQISGLSEEAAISLLNQRLDENLLAVTLTKQNLKASDPSKVPTTVHPASSDKETLALGEKLMNSGNANIMEELRSQSNGTLSKESIKVAETADLLLKDYQLTGTTGEGLALLEGATVLSNPFYSEIASLYQELENDQLVAGDAEFASGRNLIVSANAQALTPYVASGTNRKTLVMSASESLSFEGDLTWSEKPEHAARLVVMSAGEMTFAKGMTLKSATSDLVISSQKNLVLNEVWMEISQEAAIRGMRDVSLNNIGIGADSMATIKAARNLNVDGLTFSRGVSSILMEATTIRLSNVNFPSSSAVRLNSLKGAIDGKYPNFGSAIPSAEQIGRVNFIKNVSSGGNALNTRQAFDQYGQNITIGKIAKP